MLLLSTTRKLPGSRRNRPRTSSSRISGSPYAASPTIFPSCRLGLNPSDDVTLS